MASRPKRTATKRVLIINSSSDSDTDEIPTDLDDSYRVNPIKNVKTKKAPTKTVIKSQPQKKVTTKRKIKSDDDGDDDVAASDVNDVVEPKKRGRPAVKRKITEKPDNCDIPIKKANNSKKKNDTVDGGCISTTKNATTSKELFSNNDEIINKKPISNMNFKSQQHHRTSSSSNWTEPQLLSEIENIDYNTAKNIINLFNDDNTIPFMCRYRREAIGDMSPDQLRNIKNAYNSILNIKTRAGTIIKNLEKENILNDQIRSNLLCAKSLDELDHLYAPYKPASKVSLAERAKSIGLQEPAEILLYGEKCVPDLYEIICPDIEGLESIDKISEGIKQITAHIISKNTNVLEHIRKIQKYHKIFITSKVVKQDKVQDKKEKSSSKSTDNHKNTVNPLKFETYFDFKQFVKYIKPHQVLALNRGESLKVLTIKVDIPDSFRFDLYKFIQSEYLRNGIPSKERHDFLEKSFNEAYRKKFSPLVCRQIRGELTKAAEQASIDVFATNLKQLLLMSPVKGELILGIDPGFTNGCKLAIISECGDVLETMVIHPHTSSAKQCDLNGIAMAKMMNKYNCKLIGLGNGTACRETERWISDLFNKQILDSSVVKYSIVSEQGASIYSCSDIAKKEFPDLDVNLISAASIARRLNDPLGELVKIEPKHLGVGMYQHDINEKLLTESLNEVVMECVSFVGVDVNTASVALLRHVAGLTSVRAENILKYRQDNGPFTSREQLKKVKQIGDKTFVQCAGFIRIEPHTAGVKIYNLLDSTWVHPESYDLAKQIITNAGLQLKQIGSDHFIEQIKKFTNQNSIGQLGKMMGKPEERIKSVLNALQRELFRDYRSDFDKKPMFKQGLTKMSDLCEGIAVSGAITNITHFGCFVDIGVGQDGLIHVSKLNGMKPNIGDRVEAVVTQIDLNRNRIQLQLKHIN